MTFFSYHPYLFFNEDGNSITFVGFNANNRGDLIDPTRNTVIENSAMTPQIYAGLCTYRLYSMFVHSYIKLYCIFRIKTKPC